MPPLRECEEYLKELGFVQHGPGSWYLWIVDKEVVAVIVTAKIWAGRKWTLSVFRGAKVLHRETGDDPREIWTRYVFS